MEIGMKLAESFMNAMGATKDLAVDTGLAVASGAGLFAILPLYQVAAEKTSDLYAPALAVTIICAKCLIDNTIKAMNDAERIVCFTGMTGRPVPERLKGIINLDI